MSTVHSDQPGFLDAICPCVAFHRPVTQELYQQPRTNCRQPKQRKPKPRQTGTNRKKGISPAATASYLTLTKCQVLYLVVSNSHNLDVMLLVRTYFGAQVTSPMLSSHHHAPLGLVFTVSETCRSRNAHHSVFCLLVLKLSSPPCPAPPWKPSPQREEGVQSGWQPSA